MGVIVPAGAAGRTTVEGYDPKKHDPFFDGAASVVIGIILGFTAALLAFES